MWPDPVSTGLIMPYIKRNRRPTLRPMSTEIAQDEGELNFQISCLLNAYMYQHGLSYARMGDVVGACENAKSEFQRRVMAGYEDQKILENGDVYQEGVRWEKVEKEVSPIPRHVSG